MPRKSILAVVLALLALTLVVGCGGGGGNEQAAATTEAVTTTEETTTSAGETTDETTTEETVTAETETTDLSVLASAENCRELSDLGQKFSSAVQGAADSKNLKKEAELIAEFAEKTPADIRPDFRVFSDYLKKIADVVGDLKPGSTPDPEALAKLQKAAAGIDQAKLTKAMQRISAWVRTNCTR
jgi:hypothetical protein